MKVYIVSYHYADYEGSCDEVYGTFSTFEKAEAYRNKLERNARIRELTIQERVKYCQDLNDAFAKKNSEPRYPSLSDRSNREHEKKLRERWSEWACQLLQYVEERLAHWQANLTEDMIEHYVLDYSYYTEEFELDEEKFNE